jgi:hypothetical protein
MLSRPAAGGGAWAPTDLASLAAWYDFSDAATLFVDAGTTPVSADAQAIYQANDKSGSGLHLTQATAGSRPTYKTGIQNGASVGRYDGGDNLARASVALSSLVGNASGTGVVVMFQKGTTARNTVYRLDATTTANTLNVYATFDNTFYYDHGHAAGGGRISVAQPAGWDDTWHILVVHRNGATGKIYIDGGAEILSASFTDEADATQSGTYYLGGNSTMLGGDIGELVHCKTALIPADLNALGGYLAAKWGLTWNTVS